MGRDPGLLDQAAHQTPHNNIVRGTANRLASGLVRARKVRSNSSSDGFFAMLETVQIKAEWEQALSTIVAWLS